jgi:Ala-tRNA(Pro) deacylase
MPISRIKEFLDDHRVKYVSIAHSQAYTAQEIAASAHITGKELAKTVIVKLDGEMTMAVLRASDQVDLDLLRATAGAEQAELANENEFKGRFPECDPGAMPPFGNLYNMKVFVDESLTKDEQIAFNGGTHTELLRLSYRDFERLVVPKTANFSQ